MNQDAREFPMAVIICIAAALVVLIGFLVYKGASGGIQGDGKVGNIQAAPPMPPGAQQRMMQMRQAQMQQQQQRR